ncbi:hypothetical protein [Myxacorys almedinensis]|uniref:Uncharacterized protein n=1 Tax=Myxacorys almedinensis A TaxID=2690445 RepID=A0A8J8CPB0_9CYAN|nr:hypothetical protein [Myxacorys almedinensis]NDJ19292.1 hypothetical protein [Myxacorys almedinensis A]
MTISDLSYLEAAENAAIAGGNYAYVDQDADAYAGNNYSYYGGNKSIGNTAVALNVSAISQYSFKKGYGYYFHY